MKLEFLTLLFALLIGGTWGRSVRNGDIYEVGVGIGDVTGLAAGVGLMGYASPFQFGRGIHTRLFARTFIVHDGLNRVVFVSVDIGMIDTAIKQEVVRLLEEEFEGLYTIKNVLLSATHTHSGPGGYIQYAMYGVVSFGFNRDNFESIVAGIVTSIRKAHHGLQPGRLSLTSGNLLGANINRSPYAYNQNPPEEIAEYPFNVDKEMTLLRIDAEDGTELGMFNWFAVHPTSMNNTNRLVSGDNKGYASMKFEYLKNPADRPGKGPFVAAFASSNSGDVSPNIEGAKCRGGPDEGMLCDLVTSTCRNDEDSEDTFVRHCIAFGPGENGDNEESTEIIGNRMFEYALSLYNGAPKTFVPITGPIEFAQQQINMNHYPFEYIDENGQTKEGQTCSAALGFSFAGGTEDGPGLLDFNQGDLTGNDFWGNLSAWLSEPSDAIRACHGVKPILLNVGQMWFPYQWVPDVVETQMLRLGNFYLVGVPGEFTTMAGRRMRNRVRENIVDILGEDSAPSVVVAGYSNLYTHYITTFEEYQVQRYEGASTIYGPRTLDAYLHQYEFLTREMLQNGAIPDGPSPRNWTLIPSLLPPVLADIPPQGMSLGETKVEPAEVYSRGQTVRTVCVGAALRNGGMREGSYFLIERLLDDGSGWEVVATDADWNTKLVWRKTRPLFSLDSEIEITWKTDATTRTGTYRIRNFGFAKKYQVETPVPYQGTSRTFQITVEGSRWWRSRETGIPRIQTEFIKLWKKLKNGRLF